jgi:hypothetical protein
MVHVMMFVPFNIDCPFECSLLIYDNKYQDYSVEMPRVSAQAIWLFFSHAYG